MLSDIGKLKAAEMGRILTGNRHSVFETEIKVVLRYARFLSGSPGPGLKGPSVFALRVTLVPTNTAFS